MQQVWMILFAEKTQTRHATAGTERQLNLSQENKTVLHNNHGVLR